MKPTNRAIIVAVALAAGFVLPLCAADTNHAKPEKSVADAEAAYTRTIEKRAADVLAALEVKDPAKAAKVQDILIAQYRALRDWHDANDAKRKGATGDQAQQLNASLKALHDKFVSGLSAELTANQVEKVKDKMTYNKVKVTFDAYCHNVPNLTEPQKQKVLGMLKEAREEAMDAGSSDEKNKIFRKFKGRINNYLSKEGYDAKQADKEPGETPKAQSAPQ
jgi:hypothetical protein